MAIKTTTMKPILFLLIAWLGVGCREKVKPEPIERGVEVRGIQDTTKDLTITIGPSPKIDSAYWCQIEVINDSARARYFRKHPLFQIPSDSLSGDMGLVYGCGDCDSLPRPEMIPIIFQP